MFSALHQSMSRWIGGMVVGVSLMLAPQAAHAAPIVALDYVETALGAGLFQYDFTLSNLGDPIADAGFDAYDLTLFLPSTPTIHEFSLPVGWDAIPGSTPVATPFFNTFSTSPGLLPGGADIGPGQFLSGFRLVLDTEIGSTPFSVLFANPFDPASPAIFDGVSTASDVAPVPEPASLILFATAAGTLLARRRRRPVIGLSLPPS